MIKPNFKEWADKIIEKAAWGNSREDIEEALNQAYNQGYELGLNKGWAIEQEADQQRRQEVKFQREELKRIIKQADK